MATVNPAALDVALTLALVAGFAAAAILAVCEVALLRVRTSRVHSDAADGDRRARELMLLLDELPLVLNSVLFVVLLCQVGIATISGFLAHRWLGGPWVTIASVLISLLLFVYAEAIPKTMAVQAPYEWALRSARPLRLLVRVVRPIVSGLVALAALQSPSRQVQADPVSEGELRLLARESARAGSIGTADAELVERSFDFGDRTVADVMVSREHIVAVAGASSTVHALEVAIAAGHRRVPVVGADIDEVLGVVRLRDLAAASSRADHGTVRQVMSAPLFCRADDSIAQLMDQMRASGTWLAIVSDSARRTQGLVTVEDVVAELMGEIEEDPATTPR